MKDVIENWLTRRPKPRPSERVSIPPAVDVETRRTVLAEIETARASFADAHAGRAQRLQDAEAEVHRAEEMLREARVHRDTAQVAMLHASGEHDVRISRLQARLYAGAPEAIDRFVLDVAAESEATRLTFAARERPGVQDPATGWRGAEIFTNHASVLARLEALGAARAAAEGLRLAPIGEGEVLVKLEALAASIPDLDDGIDVDPVRMTPAERREIAWRAPEQNRRRWHAHEDPPRSGRAA